MQVDELNLRLRGKKSKQYQCLRCGNVLTQLNKGYGQWPTPEFLAMGEQEQNDFFGAMHEHLGKDAGTKVAKLSSKYPKH
mgnify:CR=1 FL=1